MRTATEGVEDSGVPAWDWRRGVAGELHGGTLKLTRGSGWSEGACGGGSMAAQSSPDLTDGGGWCTLKLKSGGALYRPKSGG